MSYPTIPPTFGTNQLTTTVVVVQGGVTPDVMFVHPDPSSLSCIDDGVPCSLVWNVVTLFQHYAAAERMKTDDPPQTSHSISFEA